LRKFVLALLAGPVLLIVYIDAVLRRSALVRTGAALGLGAVIAFGVISVVRPSTTTAAGSSEIVPLPQAAFQSTVKTGVAVDAPITITFSSPMSARSVASALAVEPATPIGLEWDETFTALTINPLGHWNPGAYHTITVQSGALAQTGRPLTTAVRSSFLTRAPSTAVIAASESIGSRVATDTSFTISFDRPITASSLAGGVRLDPAVPGSLTPTASLDDVEQYTFRPSTDLAADTSYRLTVDGVLDEDGVALGMTTLEVTTVEAPAVVRFRPRADTKDVERDVAISVRFTRKMDRETTKSAFKVTADGTALTGRISFAEGDKVLVFEPDELLPYDSKIVATVAATARSSQGTALAEDGRATFQTKAKPKPKPKAPAPTSKPKPPTSTGGGSVGSGSWASVERYYLKLMNCTRTGGWVTSTGSCSSPGGRNVAPLQLSSGISTKVARPYAKLLATRNLCSHFVGGNPGDRLRRAGYTNYTWAENLGCRSGNPTSAVLASHRFFQSEKSYNGGHYVNLMNSKYDRVGIGVWVSSGRVRLVVDFYHP